MTAKEFIKNKYPRARAEKHKQVGGYLRMDKTYWLIRDGNNYLPMAEGETESKAWANAKSKLERTIANVQ